MDPLQFRRPAALVYLSMREKGREIVRHGLAAVPPSHHCGTRLWARTTSDSRIRDAVAALPVESAVLDGEAIVMRSADRCDFEALRSREGQAEAILVAYDIMEADGQDVRPEPLEERRKRLAKLLSRSNKALRDGIQLSEAIPGDGATIFRHAGWMDVEGIVPKRIGSR
jgi:ATP-dependent DNA ligase